MPSAQLLKDREDLIALIRERFASVTRNGGMSWSESLVVDARGTDLERRAARAKDREKGWSELVDDQAWNHDSNLGGFCFLDPIGFRYYFAPAMIRVATDERLPLPSLDFHIARASEPYGRNQFSKFTPAQRDCVARFIQFMIAFATERFPHGPTFVAQAWRDALQPWENAR